MNQQGTDMSDTEFELIWKCFAAVLVVLILSVAGCSAHRDAVTAQLIEQGIDPIDAACALGRDGVQAACAIRAAGASE